MTHFDAADIIEAVDESPVKELVVNLTRRDSAWNPASMSHDIPGPAKITYRRYRDGGYEAVVEDLDKTP